MVVVGGTVVVSPRLVICGFVLVIRPGVLAWSRVCDSTVVVTTVVVTTVVVNRVGSTSVTGGRVKTVVIVVGDEDTVVD